MGGCVPEMGVVSYEAVEGEGIVESELKVTIAVVPF